MNPARRLAAVLAAGAAAALAAVTAPAASATAWTQVYSGAASSAPLAVRVLTPDGADVFSIAKAGGTITMTAPVTNQGGNLREVFWPAGTPATATEQACATWAAQSDDRVQEGLALRITDADGDVRAITVTKNVIFGVWWDFNVHTWDSQAAQPFTQIAQFDYSTITITAGQETPFPWRACARVQGATLTFKLWVPALGPEPAWGDPAFTRTATIPAGYLGAGQAGWYIGHIPAGGAAAYTRLGLWTGQP